MRRREKERRHQGGCRRFSDVEEMNRNLTWALIVLFLPIAGFVVLKLTVPLSYAEAELRPPAVEYVKDLQETGKMNPGECAAGYLYFKTDYQGNTPDRIRVSEKKLSDNLVRITLHDPSCRDDSTHSSIHRIFVERNEDRIWIPVKHEWSHTGRGRFGWTTEPTN